MSTLVPRRAYTDAELERLYPPSLELQQVQILLRHGERTPVSARFVNAGLHPFWPYCHAARVLGADRGTQWRRRFETFGPGDDGPVLATGPEGERDGLCDMGMLTDTGRETARALGARLRGLYVDRLGFLPGTLDNQTLEGMYLRATPIPRALESMQHALLGLYPPQWRAGNLPPLTVVSRRLADETLFPNEAQCRRLAELARAFAARAAQRWNSSPEMDMLNARLGGYMPRESPRVAVDGRPRLSGVMDSINASRAHGPATRLPGAFYEPEVTRAVEAIATEEWFAGYKESREYRALGIGSLAGDIVARMEGGAQRFALSGCHDTTLAGLLASLGAFETKAWPPFTSHVAVELFREKKGGNDNSFVRLRYNDEPVTVPGCRLPGKHLAGDTSFCTLEAFKAIVDKFTPRNWALECRSNIKAPPFPTSDETAGF